MPLANGAKSIALQKPRKSTACSVKPPQVTRNEALINCHDTKRKIVAIVTA